MQPTQRAALSSGITEIRNHISVLKRACRDWERELERLEKIVFSCEDKPEPPDDPVEGIDDILADG